MQTRAVRRELPDGSMGRLGNTAFLLRMARSCFSPCQGEMARCGPERVLFYFASLALRYAHVADSFARLRFAAPSDFLFRFACAPLCARRRLLCSAPLRCA